MNAAPSPVMSLKADIVLETPLRKRLLVVECKRVSDISPQWASHLRSNLIAQGRTFEALFFMLAISDRLYLWHNTAPPDAAPDDSASPESVYRAYMGSVAQKQGGPSSESIELALTSWLASLASKIRAPKPDSEADQMLVRSGLYASMHNAIVRNDVHA
jgi:hypothetical protein